MRRLAILLQGCSLFYALDTDVVLLNEPEPLKIPTDGIHSGRIPGRGRTLAFQRAHFLKKRQIMLSKVFNALQWS